MKAKTLTPILWTEKFDDTIKFYTETLLFTCRNKNEEWGWAALRNGDVEIMISRPNAHTTFFKSTFTGSFYFIVDDVDVLWNELKDKSTIEYPIETFDWGMREFAIRDNNGYILQFGQDVGEVS